jgi:hypothetical protein
VQAAEALKPIAGDFAFFIFTLGIVGTGLLAVPVLAGSAAYAVGEACKWPIGLSRRPKEAVAFYATLAAAAIIGVGITLSPIDPIKGPVLERGHQRHCCRARDVGDDADDRPATGHGAVYDPRLAALAGLDLHRRNGSLRHWDDADLGCLKNSMG